ncbi:hypothetical protein ABT010_33560 [Streptomyces sp. NPDC002668]|uniref:hypothetical protein n=1 Tax=Streptomyces sp. NPDC002668 TaxID=3154422 RepID=UPI003328ED24
MLIPRPRRRIGRPRPMRPGPRYPQLPRRLGQRLEQVMGGQDEDLVDVDLYDDGSFPIGVHAGSREGSGAGNSASEEVGAFSGGPEDSCLMRLFGVTDPLRPRGSPRTLRHRPIQA